MKLKEKLANEIVDDFDDCANGAPCIKDKIIKAYIMGFDEARALYDDDYVEEEEII